MKQKHIDIRIEQCLALAKASNCPRRKLAAILLDPTRNVVLADGYNGGPRGAGGDLCRGHYCERDGLTMDDLDFIEGGAQVRSFAGTGTRSMPVVRVVVKSQYEPWNNDPEARKKGVLKIIHKEMTDGMPWTGEDGEKITLPTTVDRAREWAQELCDQTPPIETGTRMERGCHHAEMNVICNAAASGITCSGAWLIVLAEPCVMCAKMIHHAGIEKVVLVGGGYLGGRAGVEYLLEHGVKVQEIEGPQDPRREDAAHVL
jgi:deoxycytidylate deaminase